MLTLLIWQTDLLWILCLFAVPERWPWAAVRDKIFTHSFLRAYSVGCRKTRVHSALRKKEKKSAVCLQLRNHAEKLGFSSGFMPVQPGCAAFWSTERTNPQLYSSTSTLRAFPPTTFLATASGFHLLPDSLLNLHQILNKYPNQLCWVTLYVFPSFRICQLLPAFLTEAHQLGASITAWGMRMYLLGQHMLKGKNCLIQSVSSSTNPGWVFSLKP